MTEELIGLAASSPRPRASFRDQVLAAAASAQSRRGRIRTAASACVLLAGFSFVVAGLTLRGDRVETTADANDSSVSASFAMADQQRDAFAIAHVSGEWNTVEAAQRIRRSQSDILQRVFMGRRSRSTNGPR